VETIERARHELGADIEHYHRRPHSGLAYRTPLEVATTWRGHQHFEKLKPCRPDPTTRTGSTSPGLYGGRPYGMAESAGTTA
jgi:hypothetical protein